LVTQNILSIIFYQWRNAVESCRLVGCRFTMIADVPGFAKVGYSVFLSFAWP